MITILPCVDLATGYETDVSQHDPRAHFGERLSEVEVRGRGRDQEGEGVMVERGLAEGEWHGESSARRMCHKYTATCGGSCVQRRVGACEM
jgi:hypothetical protein